MEAIRVDSHQVTDILPQFEYRKTRYDFQPTGGESRISGPDLFEDCLGDVEVKISLCLTPPVVGDLLMGGDDEIPARSSRQVARYRGF